MTFNTTTLILPGLKISFHWPQKLRPTTLTLPGPTISFHWPQKLRPTKTWREMSDFVCDFFSLWQLRGTSYTVDNTGWWGIFSAHPGAEYFLVKKEKPLFASQNSSHQRHNLNRTQCKFIISELPIPTPKREKLKFCLEAVVVGRKVTACFPCAKGRQNPCWQGCQHFMEYLKNESTPKKKKIAEFCKKKIMENYM